MSIASHINIAPRINTVARRVPAWLVYVASAGYAGWLLWLGLSNQLGAEPVKALEHALGEVALYTLIAGLAITPIRERLGVNLLKFRRAIGLACFFFVTMHLLTWAVLDVQRIDQIWADIVKRQYILVGMLSFVLLVPLAVTSNGLSIRRLGAQAWRRLHMLVYPAALLGAVHYVMLARGFQVKPLLLLAIVIVLVAMRFPLRKWATSRVRVAKSADSG